MNHIHNYKRQGNYYVCECGKRRLFLKDNVGVREDGREWRKKENQNRFLFPKEWLEIEKHLKPKQLHTAKILLHTGMRFNEAYLMPKSDFFYNPKGRSRITVRHVKTKARKGEFGQGKMRQIPTSKQFAKYLHEYKSDSKTFDLLSNSAFNRAFEKAGKKAGLKDYKDLSAHTLRKTFEMWLIAKNVRDSKIFAHLGHDVKTAMTNYVSPDIFSWEDIKMINYILGDLYQEDRR